MKICRFCIRWTESSSPVDKWIDVMKNLFGLELEGSSMFPQHVCERCCMRLTQSVKFQEQIIDAENSLRRLHAAGLLETLLANPKKRGEKLDDTVPNNACYAPQEIDSDELVQAIGAEEERYEQNTRYAYRDFEEQPGSKPKEEIVDITIEPVEELEIVCAPWKENCEVLDINTSRMHDESEVPIDEKLIEVWNRSITGKQSRKVCSTKSSIKGRIVAPQDCRLCGMHFEEHRSFSKHMNGHRNKDLQRYKCATCSKVFQTSTQLKRHDLIHLSDSPFKCPHCARGFNHEWNFKLHLRRHKQQDSLYPCNQCSLEYANFLDWRRHMKEHFAEDPRYWEAQDVLPESLHDGSEYPKGCAEPGCTYVAASMQLMWMHYRTHSKAFQCKECPRKFASASLLKKHIDLVHLGLRPHECVKCGKLFGYRHKLLEHLNMHDGVRHLQCKYCEKRFTHTSHLTVHERMHTGARPYMCDLCGAQFRTSSALAKHCGQHDQGNGLRIASKRCVQQQLKLQKKLPQQAEPQSDGQKQIAGVSLQTG